MHHLVQGRIREECEALGARCACHDLTTVYEEQLGPPSGAKDWEHVVQSIYQGVDLDDLEETAANVKPKKRSRRSAAVQDMDTTSAYTARKMMEALKEDKCRNM